MFYAFVLCAEWSEEEEAEAVDLASMEKGVSQGDWDCDMSKINLKKKFKATLYSMTWWAFTIDLDDFTIDLDGSSKGTYSDALLFSLFLINVCQFFVFG